MRELSKVQVFQLTQIIGYSDRMIQFVHLNITVHFIATPMVHRIQVHDAYELHLRYSQKFFFQSRKRFYGAVGFGRPYCQYHHFISTGIEGNGKIGIKPKCIAWQFIALSVNYTRLSKRRKEDPTGEDRE